MHVVCLALTARLSLHRVLDKLNRLRDALLCLSDAAAAAGREESLFSGTALNWSGSTILYAATSAALFIHTPDTQRNQQRRPIRGHT